MKKVTEVYALTASALVLFPFVRLWYFIKARSHIILQLLWTLILGSGGGIGLCVFLGSIMLGNVIMAALGFWCYISLTTLAMYDYTYIARRMK